MNQPRAARYQRSAMHLCHEAAGAGPHSGAISWPISGLPGYHSVGMTRMSEMGTDRPRPLGGKGWPGEGKLMPFRLFRQFFKSALAKRRRSTRTPAGGEGVRCFLVISDQNSIRFKICFVLGQWFSSVLGRREMLMHNRDVGATKIISKGPNRRVRPLCP